MPSKKVASAYVDLQLQTAAFQAAIGEATSEMKKFGSQMREESQKSRESVKLLSEELGLGIPRGLQGIISKLPGVTTAMNLAFDGVVVFALAKTIYEVGEKIAEYAKKSEEAAKKHAEAWNNIVKPLQDANDKAVLVNDKLDDANRKLEHKPAHNALKIAIDEAIVSADELGNKLEKDFDLIGKTLKDQAPAMFGGQLFGHAPTDDLTKKWDELNERQKSENDRYQELLRANKDSKDPNFAKNADSAHVAALKTINDEGIKFFASALKNANTAKAAQDDRFSGKYPMSAYSGWNSQNMTERIAGSRGALSALNAQNDALDINATHQRLLGINKSDTDSNEAAQLAKKAAEEWIKSLEEGFKANDRVPASVQTGKQLSDWKAGADQREITALNMGATALGNNITQAQIAALVDKRISLGSGSETAKAEERVKAYDEATASLIALGRSLDETDRKIKEAGDKYVSTLARVDEQTASNVAKGKLSQIERDLQTHVISAHTAALRESAVHAEEFSAKLKAASAELAHIVDDRKQIDPNDIAALRNNDTQQLAAKGNLASLQFEANNSAAADAANGFKTSFAGEVQNTFDSIIEKSEDWGAQFKTTVEGALTDVNDAIIHILTTRPQPGDHPFRQAGKAIATDVARTGLQDAEGSAMKLLFGHNPKAKMGTKDSPMWVQMAQSAAGGALSLSSSNGLLGGLLGKLLGVGGASVSGDAASAISSAFSSGGIAAAFGGFMADGGVLSPGDFYMTGERGPELLQVGSTSKINNARDTASILSGGSGGDVHHNWNIDARGSNDPAAIHAAVQRGIMQAAPHLIAASTMTQNGQRRRMPASKG